MHVDPSGDSLAVLQAVAQFLRSLSAEEAAQLARGEVKLELASRSRTVGRSKSKGPIDIEGVRAALMSQPNREAAMAILLERSLNRPSLEALARSLDLPVTKSDSVERLRERIVEGTIGYRLSSEAVRGDG